MDHNEQERLTALHKYNILDTPPEETFDRITEMASAVCETPISLICFVDENRQWFKSYKGLNFSETPRDISFCHHTIQLGNFLEIPDATLDERFQKNPLVQDSPFIRFYAAQTLIDSNGFAIGTICVLDTVPRKLTPQQKKILGLLAKQVIEDLLQPRISITKKLFHEEHLNSTYLNSFWNLESCYVIRTDLEGNYTYYNQKFAEVFRHLYKTESLIGSNSMDSIYELDHPKVIQAVSESVQHLGKSVLIEFRKIFPGNQLLTTKWEFICLPDKQGNPFEMLCIGVDTTEIKKIEHTLNHTLELLEKSNEASGIGYWEYEVEDDSVTYSKIASEVLDLPISTKYKIMSLLEYFEAGKHRQKIVAAWENCFQNFINFDLELRIITPTGKAKWIQITGTPVIEKNKCIRIYGLLSEISERKEAELLLSKAKQEADKANRAKSEFLANMSHEIRTPLNSVIGFTELLKNANLNKIQLEYAQNANTSARSLLGIINDILDFSKIEAGKIELDITKVDLYSMLEQTCDVVKFQSSKKGLELILNIDPSIPQFIFTDFIRVKQILVNLLSNAIKFTEKGEVELKVSFEKLVSNTGEIYFEVNDTGIGISKEQTTKLFQAFSQADTSTTRKFGGTGLGLIISQLLLQKMGSSVYVDSEPNKGSKFYFHLRVDFEEPEIESKNNPIEERALVVDDNPRNREILQNYFTHWNIPVDTCDNGLTALKMIESEKKYSVILIDFQMPFMDGLETCKKIKQMKDGNIYSTILMYNSVDLTSKFKYLKQLGIHYTIEKPINPIKLIEILTNLNTITDESNQINPKIDNDAIFQKINQSKPKILVADDVEMNLILINTVTKEFLPDAIIIEANNGKAAVEMFLKESPDIVFLDLLMPEMDGLETAKAIRNIERKKVRKVPIIALTAGVLAGEKEKCISAGMNDYFKKPIEIEKYKSLLLEWLNRPKRPIEEIIHESEVINYKQMQDFLGSDFSIFWEILQKFNSLVNEYYTKVIQAAQVKSFGELSQSAHKLKSPARTIGAETLGNLCEKIEQNARKGEVNPQDILDFQKEFRDLKDYITELLNY